MKAIPACFFPTQVVIIDDYVKILKELENTLDTTTATYKVFSNPHEGLAYLQTFHEKDSYLNKWIREGYQSIQEHMYSWRDQIYSAQRFEQVSVVIVDHTMPGLNGLELCERIQSPYIQKIMLTGDADESLAINAFNENLIQGFVRKSDPKVFDKLNTMIYKKQLEFFVSLISLAHEKNHQHAYGRLCQDSQFIKIFQSMADKFNIVEYYLMDEVGKFLMIDAGGNLSALYVYNPEESRALHHLEADDYFLNGEEFVFPPKPVKHPLSTAPEAVIGTVDGQEDEPHHAFPVYDVPGHEGFAWGYIPKLLSVRPVVSFNFYKHHLS